MRSSPADMTSRRTRRLAGVLASFVALGLVAAACDGGDDEAGGTTMTEQAETTAAPTTTEATTTTLTPEEEVLTAYRNAANAVYTAYDPPNPNHPDLLAFLSGDILARVQSLLAQYQSQGVSVVGSVDLAPTLVSLVGDTAVVEDCFVDHSQPVNTVTRAPMGEASQTVLHINGYLERIDGSWKVVRQEELSDSCTPG
jgi:hypothetical protein